LILVGLLWGAIVSWFLVILGGLEMFHWAYLGKGLLWFGWMFVGPLLLIAGPILYKVPRHRILASVLLLVGCLGLSAQVVYLLVSMFRDLADPLIMKPPYGLYAAVSALTVLSDICAVQRFRKRRST
jgi:hypothetical protein